MNIANLKKRQIKKKKDIIVLENLLLPIPIFRPGKTERTLHISVPRASMIERFLPSPVYFLIKIQRSIPKRVEIINENLPQ